MVHSLVVDEADRMIEEGHFDELFKIFTCIKEHEKHRATGLDPYQLTLKEMEGEDFDEGDQDGGGESTGNVLEDMEMEEDNGLIMMPEHLMTETERKSTKNGNNSNEHLVVLPRKQIRQTLLFSATATKLSKNMSSASSPQIVSLIFH